MTLNVYNGITRLKRKSKVSFQPPSKMQNAMSVQVSKYMRLALVLRLQSDTPSVPKWSTCCTLWHCKLVRFVFWLLLRTNKTTPSSSSPSIYATINQKTNEITKGVNQHCTFLFFASLWILPDWRGWSFGRQNKGPHVVLNIY